MECCYNEKIYDFIIIGAGSVGVEAGVMAQCNGLDVLVLEKGGSIGHNTKKYGYLQGFSPWHYNYSPFGTAFLQSKGRFIMPQSEFESTTDYLNNYLEPLVEESKLHILYDTEVLSIGKSKFSKTDIVGENRKHFAFRLLSTKHGQESFFYAWHVIDASGVYDNPLALGEGRVAALNEKRYKDEIFYQAIKKENHGDFYAKTTLVVGQTCCTAKSLNELAKMIHENADTKVIYLDETGLKPYINQLKKDIFKRRVATVRYANEFLDTSHPQLEIMEKSSVYSIEKIGEKFRVHFICNENHLLTYRDVDSIVSNCGFEPNNSIYRELQVHECYASLAPMNLASAMLEESMDYRFSKSAFGYESLQNPEPNFYILGSKSYGRNQGFALYIGIAQVAELFSHVLARPIEELLYATLDAHAKIPYIHLKKEERLSLSSTPRPAVIVASKEEKYKIITENLQEVVFETDLRQKITYLSPSWKRVSGFDVEPYMGLDWQMLLHEDSKTQGVCQCNAFMSNQLEEYQEEFKIRCSDGSIKWMEVSASILLDENGVAYGTIGSMVDITQRVSVLEELQAKNKQLDMLSITDDLTRLYNRRYFNEILSKEYERALRSGSEFALIVCDIDYFKFYNDTYGHQKGDEVIKAVAQALKKSFARQIDMVFRYGGEEFVMILPATPKENAFNVALRAKNAVEKLNIEHIKSKVAPYITMSFGLAHSRIDASQKPEELLGLADKALYLSKEQGRNRVSMYDMTKKF